MPRPSHRCDVCIDRVNRCAECRKARARVRRALYKSRLEAGLCRCGRKPIKGMSRCKYCRELNNRISGAAHARQTHAG